MQLTTLTTVLALALSVAAQNPYHAYSNSLYARDAGENDLLHALYARYADADADAEAEADANPFEQDLQKAALYTRSLLEGRARNPAGCKICEDNCKGFGEQTKKTKYRTFFDCWSVNCKKHCEG